jgi:hypothetical protein
MLVHVKHTCTDGLLGTCQNSDDELLVLWSTPACNLRKMGMNNEKHFGTAIG